MYMYTYNETGEKRVLSGISVNEYSTAAQRLNSQLQKLQ